MKPETVVAWADEMRVGLYGQVRSVWAPRGCKVRQRVQIGRAWAFLALRVDGVRGEISWEWIGDMKGATLAPVVARWREEGVQALVWDQARSHHSAKVGEVGMTLIFQPPYAPELNPAERVFEEIRRRIEGRVYEDLEQKKRAVEEVLKELASHPEQVKRLAGWEWIQKAIACL